ncbi:MAG: hypothetical protein IT457_16605 [Planctomycetes bacterium]|nr:hypothetical protein [Planctomycetota bacterium]
MSVRSLHSLSLVTIFALALVAPLRSQDLTRLYGRWLGESEDNRGEVLVIEKDVLVLDGERIPYRAHGPRTLVLGGDEDGERAEWSIEGDVLSFNLEGEVLRYRREGTAGKPKTGNPLAGRRGPDADPFARRFRGEALELALDGDAKRGYRGTLSVDGERYPVTAGTRDGVLRGSFVVDGESYEFEARLAGDRLTLKSDGVTHQLDALAEEGVTAPRPQPDDPDGDAEAPGNPKPDAQDPKELEPQALDGVFAGATQRFEHPRGWFACEFPKGWSVHSQDDSGMLVNPGLTANDTLDAIVFLIWGRLEPSDQNQPVATVIEKHLPQMREALAQQGLTVGEPLDAIATVKSKEVPGAVVEFPVQTANGQALRLWFGGLVKQDAWLAVGGVVLQDKAAAYLPKVKRIFTTLEPKPPERNPKLEAALVGRSFSSSQYGRVTESAHHASYSFAAGGVVTRRLMSNVISKPGLPGVSSDSERSGRYEVCGDIAFLYFETGQEAAQVVQQGGKVTGLRIGNAVYQ